MSDYLANLAARSVHAASTVQPRLASRFETSFAAARLTPEDGVGLKTEVAVERRTPPVPPPAPGPASRPRPSATTDSQPPPPRTPLASERIADEPAPTTDPPGALPAVPVARARPAAAASRDSEWPDVPTRGDPGSRRSAAHAAVVDARAPRVANEPPAVAEAASERPRLLPERARSTSAAPRESGPRLTPRVTPPAMTPRSAAEQQEQGPAATPTIRVTIGRVEVRAVVQPAPDPPRAAPARSGSILSLDEYLKQRNGGRR